MATIIPRDIDVSEEFQSTPGNVVVISLIKEEGLPDAAVIIDREQKHVYIYSYHQTETGTKFKPIEDDEKLEQLRDIVRNEIFSEEEAN